MLTDDRVLTSLQTSVSILITGISFILLTVLIGFHRDMNEFIVTLQLQTLLLLL